MIKLYIQLYITEDDRGIDNEHLLFKIRSGN